jgi:outer membrane receptor protein involved in Fe transport
MTLVITSTHIIRRSGYLLVAAAFCPGLSHAADPAVVETPVVEVIGVSPVKGLEQPRNEIPSAVQSISAKALKNSQAVSLPELMGRTLQGVNVNEVQGNPFQADVNYRGFVASPLLGNPQGLSVYQDGVRVNEPFGDTVNWDLIPKAGIATIDLIPGSNPLFGLNTLGGALSVNTKSGFSHAGGGLELEAGSFGRRMVEAEFGSKSEENAIFLSGSSFREDGWRDFSPSDVDQFFGKYSLRRGALEADVSATLANTDLTGNGLLPDSMLQARRASVFTKPDNTRNKLDMLNLSLGYWLDETTRLSGTVYHRQNKTTTLNGDVNDDFEGDAALDGDSGAGGGAGVNKDTAANNRSQTRQRGWGGALQWSRQTESNQLALGVTLDQSKITFGQTTELGVFDAERGVVASGVFVAASNVDLAGSTRNWGLFAADTVKLGAGFALTGAVRYNHTHVVTTDNLRAGTARSLAADYTYRKLNPSLGITWSHSPALGLYASAGQGTRAPSPIELGCADPANPCSLPNAMQADPFLKQVVTRTLELGARGQAASLSWNAAVFSANNTDDILFIGVGNSSRGYFQNFGKTRREGIELGISQSLERVNWRAGYNYVKATYQTSACLLSEGNSSRGQSTACLGTTGTEDDLIHVQAGNRIPHIPLHSLKLGADVRVTEGWTLLADVVSYSSQFVRGNENNAHQAGSATDLQSNTRTFLGAGEIKAYTLLNLGTRVKVGSAWEVFGRINNVFDKKYATAGALAENPFNAAGTFQTNSGNWGRETAFGPGAPRSAFVGVRLSM